MRFSRRYLCVIFSVVAFSNQAMTWSEETLKQQVDSLSHLQHQFVNFEHPHDIGSALNGLSSDQQIVVQSLWLSKLLNQRSYNKVQLDWVESLAMHGLTLQGSLHDHPNSLVSLIDLKAQAKSVLKLIDINHKENQFRSHWVDESIDWSGWLQPASNEYRGFINWLKKQSADELAEVANVFQQQQLFSLLPDNNALLIILNHVPNMSIAQQLLDRKTDAFTYQFIQQLPLTPLKYDGVQLLEKAIKKAELSSLSIIVLAKHYDDQDSAQTILLNALSTEEHKWHVMVALEKVSDHDFVTELTKRLTSKPSKFSEAALRQMAKGERL